MQYIKFQLVDGVWVYNLPDGEPTHVAKEAFEKYLIPQALTVYSKQLYFTIKADIVGFGSHELNMEIIHSDQCVIKDVRIGVGSRDDEAFEQTESFIIPYESH